MNVSRETIIKGGAFLNLVGLIKIQNISKAAC